MDSIADRTLALAREIFELERQLELKLNEYRLCVDRDVVRSVSKESRRRTAANILTVRPSKHAHDEAARQQRMLAALRKGPASGCTLAKLAHCTPLKARKALVEMAKKGWVEGPLDMKLKNAAGHSRPSLDGWRLIVGAASNGKAPLPV